MLGLYVSDHPLFGVEHVLAGWSTRRSPRIMADDSRPDGSIVTIGGLVTGLQFKITKQGKPWALGDDRGPRGRDRGAVLPADLRAGRATCCARTLSASSAAGSTAATRCPRSTPWS